MHRLVTAAHSFVRAPTVLLVSALVQLLGGCGSSGGSEQGGRAVEW